MSSAGCCCKLPSSRMICKGEVSGYQTFLNFPLVYTMLLSSHCVRSCSKLRFSNAHACLLWAARNSKVAKSFLEIRDFLESLYLWHRNNGWKRSNCKKWWFWEESHYTTCTNEMRATFKTKNNCCLYSKSFSSKKDSRPHCCTDSEVCFNSSALTFISWLLIGSLISFVQMLSAWNRAWRRLSSSERIGT